MQDVVLTTPRLKLRPMVEGDIPAHFALFADPEVARYWSREPWTDMTQAEESIRAIIAAREDGSEVRFGIELLSSGELIGNVGLHHFFGQNRRCEIGYALVSKVWNQGYATEALRAAIQHGFDALDLNRIEADIDPRNIGSGRVLEKLGFRKEGYMPERWLVFGEFADTVNYGLLRRYWEA
ncbi:GNAT family N-acetyltransferase [Massilia norwichensis]|uniref:GNAT family N-acetyltransferase n=1 Tax=Massilia norwichensis TaxID=1442366 RepID=A0ABT2A8D1_9BURK|nr:GNAT family N-acetyltransferase [Massilia norwichensis]MCS0590461.1 GNAT family N-acetyltransferase [Massilia norwichensis]